MASIFDRAKDVLKQFQALPQQAQAGGQLIQQGLSDRINQVQKQASTSLLNRLQVPKINLPTTYSNLPKGISSNFVFIKKPTIGPGQPMQYSQGAPIQVTPKGKQVASNFYKGFTVEPISALSWNDPKLNVPTSQRLGMMANDIANATGFMGAVGGGIKLTSKIPSELKPIAQQAKNFSRFDEFVQAVRPQLTTKQMQVMEDTATGLKNIWDKFGDVPKMPVDIDRTKMSGVLLNKSQKELEWLAPKMAGKMEGFEQLLPQTIDVKKKINLLDFARTPEYVLNKIGLGGEMAGLRKAHEAYLAELPKEIQKITDWSKRPGIGKGSEISIFKFLDGQKVSLNPAEKEVALEIKDYLAQWADKLKLPQEGRVSNYITHIFEKDLIQKEFDPDLARILKENVAGSVYDPFTQQRLGKQGYIEDAFRALDAYVKRAVRKYNMDPALESVSRASDMLEPTQYDYIKRYTDSINMRPAQVDEWIDNMVKSSPIGYKLGQRPTIAVSTKARKMVYRGLLGLNPASALKNLSQGANTYAKLGEKYTTIGYAKVVQNLPKFIAGMDTELNDVGVLADNFIEDRNLNATRKFWENADKGLFYMFNMAEKINRGAAYWGAKSKGLNRGMSEAEAIDYAKQVVRETQFAFGKIDTPLVLSSDVTKTLGQFMSYSLKQGEFLGGMVKQRDIAGLVRYTAASMAFIYTIGKAIGMEPKDLIPTVRIGVPPTAQLPVETAKAAINYPNKYGQASDEQNPLARILQSKDVQKSFMSYVPAGGQIRKTWEGLNAYSQGASTTPTGRTRFNVEQTPGNLIKGAVLGQYSLPGAQDYFNNMGKSNAQVIYEEINKASTPQEKSQKYRELIKAGKITKDNQNDVARYFQDQSMKITPREKQVRGLGVKDGSRAKAIMYELNKQKDPAKRSELFRRYIKLKIVTPEVSAQLSSMRNRQ